MMRPDLSIMQISKYHSGGGADNVAWNLFRAFRARGFQSTLAVGRKTCDDPDVVEIPNWELQSGWTRYWRQAQNHFESLDGRMRSAWRFSRWARFIADPTKWLNDYRGIEDFKFPGTWRLLDLTGSKPDIVHCHNLHNEYFDLRYLPWLSQHIPVILTIHDAWLLSGHCAHSFECERWRTGCGKCPDLAIYPSVNRDATSFNWRRKRDIYSKCKLHVATPSKWLMRKVENSILNRTPAETRIIPYGIDLSVFHPADKNAIRASLNIPRDSKVLLFAANGVRKNPFKDYMTMREAVSLVAERRNDKRLVFIALGDGDSTEKFGQAEVRFVQYQKDPNVVAAYLQIADLYIHAARVDTFPNAILEALACGTPVVATAVGGIPEQVKGLQGDGEMNSNLNPHSIDEATGMLVPQGDAEGMAISIERLLDDPDLNSRLSENASRDARERFDLERQVNDYLEWYGEISRQFSFA